MGKKQTTTDGETKKGKLVKVLLKANLHIGGAPIGEKGQVVKIDGEVLKGIDKKDYTTDSDAIEKAEKRLKDPNASAMKSDDKDDDDDE